MDRLPGRRRPSECRIICDGRRVNLSMTKADYYTQNMPSISEIDERAVGLNRLFHGIPVMCTKRDINSAFRQIRVRTDTCRIFRTAIGRNGI